MVVFTTWWRKSPFSLRAGSQTKAALTPPTSSRGFIILNRKIGATDKPCGEGLSTLTKKSLPNDT